MKEKADYEGMLEIARKLESSSQTLESIFKDTYTKMQEINQEDVWKSNASKDCLDKFNKSYVNFNKYYLELNCNAMYLKQKVANYQEIAKAGVTTLKTTTDDFLNQVRGAK